MSGYTSSSYRTALDRRAKRSDMDIEAIVKDEQLNLRNQYPRALCKAAREGLEQQIRKDDEDIEALMQVSSEGEVLYEDITNEEPPRDFVLAARRLEIDSFRNMNVYT